MRRLILIDRDGTLLVNKHYLKEPAEVELIPGAAPAIKRLNDAGHAVAVISNQSGVVRGFLTLEDVALVNAKMIALVVAEGTGAGIDRVYTCPDLHDDSPCRKPNTGMLEQASRELGLPLGEAVMIGDNASDMLAGQRAGCTTVLVRTGYGAEVERSGAVQADAVVDDLAAAVAWVLDRIIH